MRLLKLGIIFLVVIFLLITVISLLFPSQVRLSKAINLPNERDRIFALLKQDSLWHPAYQDSASAKTFGSVEKKLLAKTDSTYVLELQQQKRQPVINGYELYGAPASDSVTLQWYMDFHLGIFPWQKFSSLFYERTYGDMMQQGLEQFKRRLTGQQELDK